MTTSNIVASIVWALLMYIALLDIYFHIRRYYQPVQTRRRVKARRRR